MPPYYYHVGYIEGNSGPSSQDFSLTPGNNIILDTGIPAARFVGSSGERVIQLDYNNSSVNGSGTFSSAELVAVRYKDPCVLYLQSINRYMMVLCRVRIFTNTAPDPTSNANPMTSISDIVAFTDTVDTFNSANLTGPFWLAASTSALNNVSYRLSLGVPCAFEYTDSTGTPYLYLYYSIDPCDLTRTSSQLSFNFAVDIGDTMGTSYPGGAFTPRLGMKVMLTSHFTTAPAVAEVDWESDPVSYLNNVVPGTQQRAARLWVAVYNFSPKVVRFDVATANTRPVDPSVVVDATAGQPSPNMRSASYSVGENISLYFAANMQNPNLTSVPYPGYGVWRATAIPEYSGYTLQVVDANGANRSFVQPVFGVDFVLRHVSVGNRGLTVMGFDHVAQSTTSTNANVDPEPAMLYSGTWRVFMGHGDVYTGGTVTLQYVENGTYNDAFCPISSAWT